MAEIGGSFNIAGGSQTLSVSRAPIAYKVVFPSGGNLAGVATSNPKVATVATPGTVPSDPEGTYVIVQGFGRCVVTIQWTQPLSTIQTNNQGGYQSMTTRLTVVAQSLKPGKSPVHFLGLPSKVVLARPSKR